MSNRHVTLFSAKAQRWISLPGMAGDFQEFFLYA
jgi:hypothetical protein